MRQEKIKYFSEYYITNTGDVYSRKATYNPNGRIKKLKPCVVSSGYLGIDLSVNNKKQLVATSGNTRRYKMNKITLQDIIDKKLNACTPSPDELLGDAYLEIATANFLDKESCVKAYIAAQVAIQASKACGITAPSVEISAKKLKAEADLGDDQNIADFYMANLDN